MFDTKKVLLFSKTYNCILCVCVSHITLGTSVLPLVSILHQLSGFCESKRRLMFGQRKTKKNTTQKVTLVCFSVCVAIRFYSRCPAAGISELCGGEVSHKCMPTYTLACKAQHAPVYYTGRDVNFLAADTSASSMCSYSSYLIRCNQLYFCKLLTNKITILLLHAHLEL